MVQFLDVPRFSPIQPLDFSPLSKLADDTVSTWKAQAVGDPLSRGDFSGARAAAARAGYDIPTLLTLGDRELQAQERARRDAALAKMQSDPSWQSLPPAFRAAVMASSPDKQGDLVASQTGPNAALNAAHVRHTMGLEDARLAETRRMNDLQANQMKFQTPDGRAAIAQQYGLRPGTPEFQQFVLGGTLRGHEDAYGKAGTIVQAGDGSFYTVQFGSNGKKIVEPLTANGQPLTPSKGVKEVGDLLIDSATGRVLSNVGANIAGAASAKEQGEARGKAVVDLPRIEDNATLMLDTIQKARMHPGREAGTGPIAGRIGAIGGDQAGFVALMDQIQGKAFLEAFNSLRGGGQITEVEGKKATDAIARLNRVQTKRDFDAAMDDLQSVVTIGLTRARRNAQGGQVAPTAPASAAPSTAGPQLGSVPPGAVQLLKQNPTPQMRLQFDEIFGAGASDRILGGR